MLLEEPPPVESEDSSKDPWSTPPAAAEDEVSPPYLPDEPVTTVSIAPTPELHVPAPESIAPAPELVATSPDLKEPTPEPYVPATEPVESTLESQMNEPFPSATLPSELDSSLLAPPPLSSPAEPVRQDPPQVTMSSLGGMGTVNLDHFIGGLPAINDGEALNESPGFMIGGGVPITLPPLPKAPEWFGRITRDFSFKPRPAPPLQQIAPPPPPPPPIEIPESSIESSILDDTLSLDDAPAVAEPADEIAEAPVAKTPVASPPVVAPPKPAAPPPKLTSAPAPAKPTTAKPGPVKPSLAKPAVVKPPPPSFTPRRGKIPFSTEAQEISETDIPTDQSFAAAGPAAGSMPFDGLAMPNAGPADPFSSFTANPVTNPGDTVFGGPSLDKTKDIAIPETTERAKHRSDNVDQDFADDDFWNRTDEEDDLAANKAAPPKPAMPVPPPVIPRPPVVAPPMARRPWCRQSPSHHRLMKLRRKISIPSPQKLTGPWTPFRPIMSMNWRRPRNRSEPRNRFRLKHSTKPKPLSRATNRRRPTK